MNDSRAALNAVISATEGLASVKESVKYADNIYLRKTSNGSRGNLFDFGNAGPINHADNCLVNTLVILVSSLENSTKLGAFFQVLHRQIQT